MKRTTLLGSAGALILGALSSHAMANEQFVAADNTVGTQLCMAITKDNPFKLDREMDKHHIRHHIMTKKLLCNDLSVREFASLYGFERSLKKLRLTPLTETSIHDLAQVHGDTILVVSGSK
ncbi:DUF3718 domain-containing protein [Pseudoalteromonas sp. BDTF-M6]|uniref:DUF3718 domain-containing protein n=1 Tax=Pseudoalteromonas sp. BDTF-M6 TaxID=2796132 RepID=UPI001BB0740E|nr:DUF3718 domain-containing protein [Pseudoalteromonas sp. BDTF-M6]MBS3796549.1 DUF3718 domain-containing protein [Pseudoalteromonas sp. BDTF-M6]